MRLAQSIETGDRILLALSAIGCILFSAALWNEHWFRSFYEFLPEGEPIGRFIEISNDTRRRRSRSLTWYDSRHGDAIFDRDSVFTGPNSEALLEVNGLQKLQISPNSLVVIQSIGDQVTIDLKIGQIATKVNRNKKLRIVQRGRAKDIDSRTTEVKIRSEPGGVIRILESKSEDDPVSTIEPFVAHLHGPEAPELAPLTAPKPETLKSVSVLKFKPTVNSRDPASVVASLLNPPELVWSPVENATEYELEIASEPEFETAVYTAKVREAKLTWREAKPGKYYWRVRAHSDKGLEPVTGEAAELFVRLTPPDLKVPDLPEETVKAADELRSPKVSEIQWSDTPYAHSYVVKVNGVAKAVTGHRVQIELTPNTVTKLEVTAVDRRGQPISGASRKEVKLTRNLHIPVPETKFPMAGSTIVAFGDSGDSEIIFSWQGVAGAQSYELELSGDSNFNEITFSRELESTSFIFKDQVAAGKTYWRVRAKKDKFASGWSTPKWYQRSK